MPQDDVEEGCSGAKGPDEAVTLPVDRESDFSSEEGCSGTKVQDKEAESDRAQEITLNVDSESDLLAKEGCVCSYRTTISDLTRNTTQRTQSGLTRTSRTERNAIIMTEPRNYTTPT